MLIKEIRALAEKQGIPLPKRAKKEVLIHTIQEWENNWPCYATGPCWKQECLWFEDCQKEVNKKQKA